MKYIFTIVVLTAYIAIMAIEVIQINGLNKKTIGKLTAFGLLIMLSAIAGIYVINQIN